MYSIGVGWGSSHEATVREAWSLVAGEELQGASQVANDLQGVRGIGGVGGERLLPLLLHAGQGGVVGVGGERPLPLPLHAGQGGVVGVGGERPLPLSLCAG